MLSLENFKLAPKESDFCFFVVVMAKVEIWKTYSVYGGEKEDRREGHPISDRTKKGG